MFTRTAAAELPLIHTAAEAAEKKESALQQLIELGKQADDLDEEARKAIFDDAASEKIAEKQFKNKRAQQRVEQRIEILEKEYERLEGIEAEARLQAQIDEFNAQASVVAELIRTHYPKLAGALTLLAALERNTHEMEIRIIQMARSGNLQLAGRLKGVQQQLGVGRHGHLFEEINLPSACSQNKNFWQMKDKNLFYAPPPANPYDLGNAAADLLKASEAGNLAAAFEEYVSSAPIPSDANDPPRTSGMTEIHHEPGPRHAWMPESWTEVR